MREEKLEQKIGRALARRASIVIGEREEPFEWEKLLTGTWRLEGRKFHDADVVQIYRDRTLPGSVLDPLVPMWLVESRTHSPVVMCLVDVRRLLVGAYQEVQDAV